MIPWFFGTDMMKFKANLAVVQKTEILVGLGDGDDVCIVSNRRNMMTCKGQLGGHSAYTREKKKHEARVGGHAFTREKL
jgi:hypothetical protein